jgi:hypothetical protein
MVKDTNNISFFNYLLILKDHVTQFFIQKYKGI